MLNAKEIGKKIREIRIQKNLTQTEVARRAGIALRSYVLYESGEREPKLSILQKIADALDVPVLSLIDAIFDDKEYKYICENIKKYPILKKDVHNYIKALLSKDENKVDKVISALQEIKKLFDKYEFIKDKKGNIVLFVPKK